MLLKAGPALLKNGMSLFRFEALSPGCHVVRIITGSGNIIKQLHQ
jgi:hypothetical protein